MFERLDEAPRLTGNQIKIIAAATIGDMLEFFDYFLIGFVLAFIVKPWQLTFGQSAIILLSSGIGAILGAFVWGRIADVFGRRTVFVATVVNFSVVTAVLAFTPDHGWLFLSVFRFFVGFGVGGLYCVDLPLVQESVPSRWRGLIGGLVTVFIRFGVMIASFLGAFLAPAIGWHGPFLVGLVPALFTLAIRAWVPQSPHWRMTRGRPDQARRSLAWVLQVPPTHLRTTGIGSAYGFGGIGKIIGPLGLALIVGSSNVVKPDVAIAAIPASVLFLSAWLVLCGLAFLLFGFETRQRPITVLDADYAAVAAPIPIRAAMGARQ